MDKIVKKGKVVRLPLNDEFSALHLDFDGVGFPLGELFRSEGIFFEECFFKPYIDKEIVITLEKENGAVKQLTIEEVK